MRHLKSTTSKYLLVVAGGLTLALVLAACGTSTPAAQSTPLTKASTTTTKPSTTTVPPSTTTTVPPSTTTTTTVPPSTTTTSSPVPALLTLAGGTPQYRPSQFSYTQDGTGYVDNLSWSTWSAGGASGSGTLQINDCQPNCAAGTTSAYPATVALSGASQTAQGYLYTQMVINAPSSPSGSQSFTLPR